jgi:carboxylesterase
MIQRLKNFTGKAKSIIFADPKLLYKEERHLVNKPFFFEGDSKKAIILIHGWTSTPYEVRRLGKFLNENGFTVSGIQLKGHGTTPSDLENVSWRDWQNDLETEYERLKNKYEKIYIGGTSIGGSLALNFAKKEKNIAGLLLMAVPYKIKFEKLIFLFGKLFLKINKKYQNKFYPPTFGVATTITRLISYQSYPTKSALEAFEAIKESRKNLEKVVQPLLIMQSTHDHVISKNSLEKIYSKVGCQVKKKQYIYKAYHTFISDIKNEHIFEDILEFLNSN